MIGRIFIGIILFGFGFIFVQKTDWPLDLIGYIDFAEKVFSGGSRTLYKIIGVLMIFISFIVILNMQDKLLGFIAGLMG